MENDGDEELAVLALGEQFARVVAAQIAMDVEALVEEQLDKLLSVQAEQCILLINVVFLLWLLIFVVDAKWLEDVEERRRETSKMPCLISICV